MRAQRHPERGLGWDRVWGLRKRLQVRPEEESQRLQVSVWTPEKGAGPNHSREWRGTRRGEVLGEGRVQTLEAAVRKAKGGPQENRRGGDWGQVLRWRHRGTRKMSGHGRKTDGATPREEERSKSEVQGKGEGIQEVARQCGEYA